MDVVVAVALGVLSFVFVASLLAFVFLCRRKFRQKDKEAARPILRYTKDNQDCETETPIDDYNIDVALKNYDLTNVFELGPNIDRIIKSQDGHLQLHGEGGAFVHCIEILHCCHIVADKLTQLLYKTLREEQQDSWLIDEICAGSRMLSLRIDDLVQAMFPLQDFALLEARAGALALATQNLSLLIRTIVPSLCGADWLKETFAAMNYHVTILRELVQREKMNNTSSSSRNTPGAPDPGMTRPPALLQHQVQLNSNDNNEQSTSSNLKPEPSLVVDNATSSRVLPEVVTAGTSDALLQCKAESPRYSRGQDGESSSKDVHIELQPVIT